MSDQALFIVAIDGSEYAARAAEFAAHETVLRNGHLLLVHVIDWSGFEVLPVGELEGQHSKKEKARAEAERDVIAPLMTRLTAEGLKVETRIEFGDPDDQILALVKSLGARQVFVGRHAGSAKLERVVGSLPVTLARQCPVPVTVVP
jgi:nucleotide-binding universal stress UspA family protein